MTPLELRVRWAAPGEAGSSRRGGIAVLVTIAVGTTLLFGTLAAPPRSALFYGLGVAAGLAWVVGALASGRLRVRQLGRVDLLVGVGVGLALFVLFVAAKALIDAVPLLAESVDRVLDRADGGNRSLVLLVALLNGLGEELFFRGAVYGAFEQTRPVLWTTVVYVLVTIATLNAALVAAALLMGVIFAAERRATGSVLATAITHLTWTALMITLLPR